MTTVLYIIGILILLFVVRIAIKVFARLNSDQAQAQIATIINESMKRYWGSCPGIKISDINVLSHDKDIVHYRYFATLLKNGVDMTASDCPPPNRSLLQALANAEFETIRAGTQIQIGIEKNLRSGEETIVMTAN